MLSANKINYTTENIAGSLKDLKSYYRSRLPYPISNLIITKILKKEEPYREYNDIYKCIFIHIPKTGGTSVLNSLFEGELKIGHSTVDHYEIFDREKFNSYYKFAFVRNPWDRLLSAYNFLRKGGMYSSDKVWADKYLSEFTTFEDFVLSLENKGQANRILRWVHFIPQHKFICDHRLNLKVDFVGRFEKINQDFTTISHQLGLDLELPHLNKSKKVFYQDCYTSKMTNIVAELYRKDIEIFDYS